MRKQPRFLYCLCIHVKPEVPYISYIAHFLSEINEAKVTGKQQIYSLLQVIYIYFYFMSHIYRFQCFLQYKT